MDPAKRVQLDSAIEYALERALAERPPKPLPHVAQKLRLFDDAVNGLWPLRDRSEAVFRQADSDGSGHLDLSELRAMHKQGADGLLQLADASGNGDGRVSLAEWLVYMRQASADSYEGAKALLDLYEKHLREAAAGEGGDDGS